MPEKLICAVLEMEYGSAEDMDRSAEKFKACPHVTFWATRGDHVHVVLILPEGMKWWAEYIGEHPGRTFGGENASLVFPEMVHQPSKLEMLIPKELGERSPCDAYCPSCPSYVRCLGCPATIHYKGER